MLSQSRPPPKRGNQSWVAAHLGYQQGKAKRAGEEKKKKKRPEIPITQLMTICYMDKCDRRLTPAPPTHAGRGRNLEDQLLAEIKSPSRHSSLGARHRLPGNLDAGWKKRELEHFTRVKSENWAPANAAIISIRNVSGSPPLIGLEETVPVLPPQFWREVLRYGNKMMGERERSRYANHRNTGDVT